MNQVAALGLTHYLAGTLVAVAMAAIFAHYFRVFGRPHLRLWSFSFLALATYLTCSSATAFVDHTPASDPRRLILAVLALVSTYWQVVLLVMGTWLIWRKQPWTRAQLMAWLGVAALFGTACALAFAWTPEADNAREFLRSGLRQAVIGLTYLFLGISIAWRWPVHKLGQHLSAFTLGAYGCEQLLLGFAQIVNTYGSSAFPNLHFLQILDPIAQMFIALGLIVWLLEHERARTGRATAAYEHLKHFDPLTGLPNRRRMLDHLKHSLAEHSEIVLLQVRIDNLSQVASALGIEGTEAAIAAAAERIDEAARTSGTFAARLDADHFTLHGAIASGDVDAAQLAEQVLAALARPFSCGLHLFPLESSCGIALAPHDSRDAEALLSYAEIARARAHQEGNLGYRYYAPDLNQQAEQRLALHAALRSAFHNDEFTLLFQPILDGVDHSIHAFEALVRWQHPKLGRLAPESFIGELEPLGLTEALDNWVLGRACRLALDWQRPGRPVAVAVNISAHSFQHPEFPDRIAALLEETGLPATCLELEIVESIALEEPERALVNLQRLRVFGVRVILDDFGTGFSSLKYLRQLPIDGIKIDRSFVTDVLVDPRDAAIVRAILTLSHSLGISVVAEGIESAAQLAWFKAIGCDRLQGFHFRRPMEHQATITLLRPRAAASSLQDAYNCDPAGEP